MYKYISNQDEILRNILKDVKEEIKLGLITGASGTGKSFLLNNVEENTQYAKIYRLEGDYYSQSRDFYPFANFINAMYIKDQTLVQKKLIKDGLTTVKKELGSWSPLGSDFLSACISELSESNKKKRELYNFIFDKDELDILFPLEYFCSEDSRIIFIIDDIQYWDEKSIRFLYTLLRQKQDKHTFLNNAIFIGAINLDFKDYAKELDGIIKLAKEHLYHLKQVDNRNYKVVMHQLGLSVKLNDNLMEALYSITAGNLQLSSDIVLLLNNENDIDGIVHRIITDKNLGHLLIERLNKVSDKGNMINETLKYASLFGSSFYYHDLEQVLNQDESYVRSLVDAAQKFCLVNGSANSASFIHELIREAYKNETYENKVKYYC
ncbi:MAG: AAA family ATPase [Eubacteriales bacterium]|nr:AAA family ATPase [Eubacteriales bacterium]